MEQSRSMAHHSTTRGTNTPNRSFCVAKAAHSHPTPTGTTMQRTGWLAGSQVLLGAISSWNPSPSNQAVSSAASNHRSSSLQIPKDDNHFPPRTTSEVSRPHTKKEIFLLLLRDPRCSPTKQSVSPSVRHSSQMVHPSSPRRR